MCLALLQIQPKLWIRYVDDTFVIIKWAKLEETHKLINYTLFGIKFTREEEKNKQLPLLDVMVEHKTTTCCSNMELRQEEEKYLFQVFKD
eukprot:g13094.t1